jgi:hypothetical protein
VGRGLGDEAGDALGDDAALLLKASGAWPLTSLRQSFLNGALTRLLDADAVLRGRVVEFVKNGDFGLASGPTPEGGYERLWFAEPVGTEEVAFEPGVFLLTKARAKALKEGAKRPSLVSGATGGRTPAPDEPPISPANGGKTPEPEVKPQAKTLRLTGEVPPAVWSRMGTTLIPKLRSGSGLKLRIDFAVTLNAELAEAAEKEIQQVLEDLGLKDKVRIE